jgi:hypothetical protein
VAPDYFVDTLPQDDYVERPDKALCPTDAVNRIFWLQLVEKPESLLSKREGSPVARLSRLDLLRIMDINSLLLRLI